MYNRSMGISVVALRRRVAFTVCAWLMLLINPALPALGQAAVATQETQRKTSTPYTGDLSIFDYPDRDQKLHINQVMDLLGMTPGTTGDGYRKSVCRGHQSPGHHLHQRTGAKRKTDQHCDGTGNGGRSAAAA